MEPVPLIKKHKVVYTIVERGKNRKFWLRIGAAFINRDGSMNVHLDAVPINGQLQIRDYKPLEDMRGRSPYETRNAYGQDEDAPELAAG